VHCQLQQDRIGSTLPNLLVIISANQIAQQAESRRLRIKINDLRAKHPEVVYERMLNLFSYIHQAVPIQLRLCSILVEPDHLSVLVLEQRR
jgi:hypothetical protein